MSSTAIDRVANPAVPTPGFLGQATAIEQSRAVAEVQAAIVVAQQCPRNIQQALADMRDSCRQMRLAERAFYRFPRGGETVSGSTVHLARELARCWGNIQYGIAELRRDDAEGFSEMQAYAWDVQTNTRAAQIFIVPHKRDTKQGVKSLTDLRDIYENSANNGARRVRAAIFSILPPWFVQEAEELCNKTLTEGGGVPLPQRIAAAISVFERQRIAVDRLEQKLGRPSAKWTEWDVAQLQVAAQSIARGEVTADEEFPPQRVTADEIRGQQPPAPAGDDEDWPPVAGPGESA